MKARGVLITWLYRILDEPMGDFYNKHVKLIVNFRHIPNDDTINKYLIRENVK